MAAKRSLARPKLSASPVYCLLWAVSINVSIKARADDAHDEHGAFCIGGPLERARDLSTIGTSERRPANGSSEQALSRHRSVRWFVSASSTADDGHFVRRDVAEVDDLVLDVEGHVGIEESETCAGQNELTDAAGYQRSREHL